MTQTPTPVYVVTTYDTATQETDTAGGFTVLTAAKREAQEAFGQIEEADALTGQPNRYRIFIEEWHASTFVAHRHLRADTTSAPNELAWYVQSADSAAPIKEGGLIE